jgi:outer membrane lipoprotein-sorting protein
MNSIKQEGERAMKLGANRPLATIMQLMAGILLLFGNSAWSQAPGIDWDLDEAIYQIERQAKDFQSAMSHVDSVITAADGSESSRSAGTGFIRKDGRMRYNMAGGNITMLVDKNYVSTYNAEAKQVEEVRLSKNKDRIEPFVRLGFSTSGKDLKDDFLITIIGEENIGNSRTLVLELTPKKDKVRETVRLVRLWIDQASWMPVQQEFSRTSDGSKVTHTYTGMARNLKLNPDLFKDNWPRGTEKIKK